MGSRNQVSFVGHSVSICQMKLLFVVQLSGAYIQDLV